MTKKSNSAAQASRSQNWTFKKNNAKNGRKFFFQLSDGI